MLALMAEAHYVWVCRIVSQIDYFCIAKWKAKGLGQNIFQREALITQVR